MGLLDSWVPVTSLEAGRDYRCEYAVTCIGIENAELVSALDQVGIVTAAPGVGGLVSSALTDSVMDFRPKTAMSASEFHGRLVAAFVAASNTAWVSCSTPQIKGLFMREAAASPFQPFALGSAFALVVVFALVGVVVWKTK